jgi:membrane protein implicated in regulation of membrane protease activity
LKAVLSVYVPSLLVGLGILVVQLFLGHDTGGHDVPHGDGGHDISPWSTLASIRFWSFALLAFGLVGTLLTTFGFAAGIVAAAIASAAGLASGLFAVTVITRLLHRSPQTDASYSEVRGRLGRVVVPISIEARGKVRVDVKGTAVDVVARANETIDTGEAVVVEEVYDDGNVLVSRAPKELGP